MTHATKRIIVVDDEPLVRMGTADTLRDGGFAVAEGKDAADALDLLFNDAEVVVALVTDVEMPGAMNGVDLAWHTHRRRPTIALVIISGGQRPASADMPPNTRFLAKPVSELVLLREVCGAIDDKSSG